MKNCSFCGAENEDAAVFCEECGKSFYKKCDKCGAENKLTAKFCNKCGARFIAPNTICYTATEKIQTPWVNENSISHDFDDGNGYIVLKNGVNSIDVEIFKDCNGLASLTIPDSVTEITIPYWTIGEYKKLLPSNVWDKLKEIPEPHTIYYDAKGKLYTEWIDENCISHDFQNGKGKIQLKDGVSLIWEKAFYNCIELSSVTIPNSITSIGEYAFYKCSVLTSINIPDSVTEIGNSAFRGCSGLTTINIPDTVTSIGDYAFEDCSGLTSINIHDSVTEIGKYAFHGCIGLTSIIVAQGNGKYDSRDNCNAIIETATNKLVVGCMNTTIPDSITEIGDEAFSECSGLPSINIPNSVKVIGKSAFEGCGGLPSINIPNSVKVIGKYAFEGCSGLTSINIPDSVTEIGGSAFSGCSGLTSIVVAKGNGKYDSRNNCNAIIETATNTLVTGCMNTVIPDSVTEIGGWTFDKCSGLTSVTIPSSVTSIGHSAFYDCSGLTSVTIPNSVRSIDAFAFGNCSGLTSITIPNSIESIGDYAFAGCNNLQFNEYDNAYYLGNEENQFVVLYKAISTDITSCNINTSCKFINENAFFNCRALTSISIPNSMISIGVSAFFCCYNLSSAYYSGNIIQWCKIKFCSEFSNPLWTKSYYLMYEIAEYKEDAWLFDRVHKLYIDNNVVTNLVVPDDVTEIKDYTFSGASCLRSVVIPDSVTKIGNGAFRSCSGLFYVFLPDSIVEIGDNAFEDVYSIVIPTGTIEKMKKILPEKIWNKLIEKKDFDHTIYYEDKYYTYNIDKMFDRCNHSFCKQRGYNWIGNNSVSKSYNGGKGKIRLYDGVTAIGQHAFKNFELKSIIIPSSVKIIGDGAFYGCSSLSYIFIPDSLEQIDSYAFAGCCNLKHITIPKSVKYIGSSAFSGIPNVVYNGIAIGCRWGAFTINGYEDGDFVYFDETKTYLTRKKHKELDVHFDGNCFYCGSGGGTLLYIPDSVSKIGNSAFSGEGMYTVIIPSSVTNIGNFAFANCINLRSIVIPESVQSIGKQAFYGCDRLSQEIKDDLRNRFGSDIFDYHNNDYNDADEDDWDFPYNKFNAFEDAFEGSSDAEWNVD